MSHKTETVSWPALPAPRTPEEAESYFDCGGASPSNPDEWPAIEALIAAHPDGVPLPAGWTAAQTRARLDIYQSGELGLFLTLTVKVGEGEEEGKTWGESCQVTLPTGDLTAAVASAPRHCWTSGQTAAEKAAFDAHIKRQGIIREWANSQSARVIPWGDSLDGCRRDIADCLDALSTPGLDAHHRRTIWIQVVRNALDDYPTARAGLVEVMRELGLAEMFGFDPDQGTPAA